MRLCRSVLGWSVLYATGSFAQPPPNCNPILDNDQYEPPTGLPVAWAPEDIPVPYYINPANYPAMAYDPSFELIRDAFARWQREAFGALAFCYAGTTDAAGHHTDFQNTISFGDVESDVSCPNVALTSVVASSQTFSNADGVMLARIVDADIVFNDTTEGFFVWGDDADLASCGSVGQPSSCPEPNPPYRVAEIGRTATHEIGHFIGLNHTSETVMDAAVPYCNPAGGQIIGEDITCLRYLYPTPTSLPSLVVTCDLSLSPLGPHFVGQAPTAATVVTNTTNATMVIDTLAVTGRHVDGSVWDFPFHANLSLEAGGQYVYQDERVLGLPGDYTFEVSHREGGVWIQTPPLNGNVSTFLSVSGVSPTQPFFAGAHNTASTHEVFIYPSLGDGTFQQEEIVASFASEIRALQVADFDQDGQLDIFAALVNQQCWYLHNDGAIVFTPTLLTTIGHVVPWKSAAAGDFTGDEYPDIVVVAGEAPNEQIYLIRNPGADFSVSSFAVPGAVNHDYDVKHTDAGYVDQGNTLDIVVNYYRGYEIHLLRGDGAGGFTRSVLFSDLGEIQAITLGDFNRDLKLDLLVGMDDDIDPGQTWINSGNGNGTFNPDWMPSIDSGPAESGYNLPGAGSCDAYDFNNDGWTDVVTFAERVAGLVFPGDSAFAFAESTVVYTTTGTGVRRTGAAPAPSHGGVTLAGRSVATNLGTWAAVGFDSVSLTGVTALVFDDPQMGPAGTTTLAVLDIATTATFQDSVSLAIPYAQYGVLAAGVDENTLQLYQSSGALRSWTAIPVILNTSADLLHARVATLSSFALAGTVATGVSDTPSVPPGTVALFPPRPNPSAQGTSISFQLPKDENVVLRVYDVRGRLVRTLLSDPRPAGLHTLTWDGRDNDRDAVPAGVYFYRLSADGRHEAQKVVLVK